MFKHPRPILIVDDDVELVTLLVDYLQLEGFAPLLPTTAPRLWNCFQDRNLKSSCST